MNQPRPNPDDPLRIDLEAAEWLVKRDRGFTPAEQDEFLQWLAADARHGEWLARHQQTWGDFDQLAQWRPEHSVEPNPDLLARARPRSRWRWPVGLAMAAGIAACVALWRPVLPEAIENAHLTGPSIAQAYERRTLEDGSTVELNRGAAIDVRFSPGERRIILMGGEAHFTVTQNRSRPFVVHARGVDVRAVGTSFNVRLEAASVEVLVTHGKIALMRPGDGGQRAEDGGQRTENGEQNPSSVLRLLSSEVSAGQRAVVSLTTAAPPQIVAVSTAEIAQALAWQPPLFDFSSVPLAQVVQEFNRRNRVQLIVAPELETLPIVASIRADNVEGFVRMLRDAAGVRAEYRGSDQIVLHAR